MLEWLRHTWAMRLPRRLLTRLMPAAVTAFSTLAGLDKPPTRFQWAMLGSLAALLGYTACVELHVGEVLSDAVDSVLLQMLRGYYERELLLFFTVTT